LERNIYLVALKQSIMGNLDRRHWLKQSGLALAGMAFAGKTIARSPHPFGWDEEANEIIRIGSNENPYGPSPMAREAMMKAIETSNRYPWPVTTQLREKIGKMFGLTENHVLMGAGSSELLGVTAALAAQKPGNAIAAFPTFRLWFTAAENFGLTIKSIPCTADKKHDLQAMLNAMDTNTRMVYIVNPHNPTGTVLPAQELQQFVERMSERCIVLLDEAYTEYSDEPTLARMVAGNVNLVVAKTFSKIYGLAGARAGYVLAHPETIKKLANYMPWANAGTSAVSLAGALASLDDKAFVKMTRSKTDEVRTMLHEELRKMSIPFTESHTSFIYYDTASMGKDVAKACEEANIQGVRTFEQGTGWRRTSIGTMQEMEKFVAVLKKLKG
jgi:histidinol-phosphate aminotransferase